MFTFDTSVLPKQLKVAFLRVSVDPYIPNPLQRRYACQVIRHHENKCKREEICANCQPKHSADGTDCKRPAKCINSKKTTQLICGNARTTKLMMKSCVQWNQVYGYKKFGIQAESNWDCLLFSKESLNLLSYQGSFLAIIYGPVLKQNIFNRELII